MKLIAIAILLAILLTIPAMAATEDVPACDPVGKVGAEVLYYCADAGCFWDPSTIVQTGMLECD